MGNRVRVKLVFGKLLLKHQPWLSNWVIATSSCAILGAAPMIVLIGEEFQASQFSVLDNHLKLVFPKLQKNCQRRKQFGSTCVKSLWPMLEDSLSLQGKLLILMTTLRFQAKLLIWMP